MDPVRAAAAGSVQFDRNRAAVLETLYEYDERHSMSHPHHHCYTGLIQKYRERIGADRLDEITCRFHLPEGPGILGGALEVTSE